MPSASRRLRSTGLKRDAGGEDLDHALPFLGHDDVGHVASVMAGFGHDAVHLPGGVEVSARAVERGLALADGVEMDGVRAGRHLVERAGDEDAVAGIGEGQRRHVVALQIAKGDGGALQFGSCASAGERARAKTVANKARRSWVTAILQTSGPVPYANKCGGNPFRIIATRRPLRGGVPRYYPAALGAHCDLKSSPRAGTRGRAHFIWVGPSARFRHQRAKETGMTSQPPNQVGDNYVLPTGREDQSRLDLIHAVYGRVSKLGLEAAAISGVSRAADIGCGTGTVSRWMAERMGASGRVVAIDIAPEQIDVARSVAAAPGAASIHYAVGSAYEPTLEENAFDLVFCRLVLCHLKEPGKAVAQMARLLRPGGRLVLVDLDLRDVFTMPPCEFYPAYVNEVVIPLQAAIGVDYSVGLRLHRLMSEAERRHPSRSSQTSPLFVRPPKSIYGRRAGRRLCREPSPWGS